MRIAFGIWDHFERRPGIPVAEQYQEKIALLREAERLGFYCYHVAEHHLSSLDMAPSPSVFLAALAQATSRLHVGTMVYILPLYHPVRLVQELCMLDQLSNGRLEVGVGRGVRSVEHDWFEIDPAETRARHDEILQIIVSALSSGNLAYEGRFYQIGDAPMDLLTLQRPYPPLWYAGGTDFAARHRLNFLTRTPQEVVRYWSMLDQHQQAGSPGLLNPHIQPILAGITKHLVVRETDAEAIAVARRAWPRFQDNWFATSLAMPDGRPGPTRNDDFDAVLAENGRLLVGSPATIRAYLEMSLELLRDRPSFYFAPAIQWGDLSLSESLQTLRLFAEEVMPAFVRRQYAVAGA